MPVSLAFSSACSGPHQWNNAGKPDFKLRPYLGCFEVSGMRSNPVGERIQMNNAKCMASVCSVNSSSIFVLVVAVSATGIYGGLLGSEGGV